MKRLLSLIILLIIGMGTAVAMSGKYPSGTWRYRVTVEIATPEGIKSGSSVHELSVATPLIDLPDVGNPANIKGEAIVVDLGERGVVFVLMSNQSWQNGLYQAFPTKAPSSTEGIRYYKETLKLGMSAEWKTYTPTMVTFTDINDPKSVRLVKGGRFNVDKQDYDAVDDFEKMFGEGVRFKRAMVEITDAPVTEDIVDKYLPEKFWQNFRNWMLSMNIRERGKFVHLFRFKKGNKK